MADTHFLGRKAFWAGVLSTLLAAVWLHLGRDLEIGTLRAPRPGAFPLVLALVLLLFGAGQILRATRWLGSPGSTSAHGPAWRSPIAIALTAVALAAAALAFLGPLTPYFARVGPAASLAWHLLVLSLGATAAWMLRGGAAALGTVLIGLILGTSGIDPVTTGIARFASIDAGLWFNVVHGLILAFIAYHVGFNALVIALAVALSPVIEKPLRESLASAEGISAFLNQPVALALLAAALAALAAGPWSRRKHAFAVEPAGAPSPEASAFLTRPELWAGPIALLSGAAGLYFGANIAFRNPELVRGGLGPGAAPMALSGALVLLGALLLARLMLRPAAADGASQTRSRSPATIGAIAILSFLVVLMFVFPIGFFALGLHASEFMLQFGPAEIVALIVAILTLCIAAAWLLPRGSLLRALSAVCLGLLIGTLGIDMPTGVVRYVQSVEFEAAHGLVVGFIAYRAGLNPLLIAIGFVYSEKLENSLRQSLLISQGDLAIFADRQISLALLVAALAVIAVAIWLRWRTARAATRAGPLTPPLRAR